MEEEENNKLAALDLGSNVTKKWKKNEFDVHYKKNKHRHYKQEKSNRKEGIKESSKDMVTGQEHCV